MTTPCQAPVLLVDDEDDLRETLRDLLVDAGFRVEVAANGREAMAILARTKPCVVILDIIMPEMSGLEVYAAMQANPELVGIPVIVSTSDSSRAPSGVLLMKKPINVDRLLKTVATLCTSSAASPA
jgi:CheY-like chemotaxis protein